MTRGAERKRIRVLIAEDSPTARVLLRTILESSSDFIVVGEACNGAEAIERAIELSPDLIVMDVHMPVLDGLDATKEIMREAPAPILMVSGSSSNAEVSSGLSATQAGALMLLEKPRPTGAGSGGDWSQFLAMARAMSQVKVVRRWSTNRLAKSGPRRAGAQSPASRLIAVGTSTGGPAALQRILVDLPPDFAAPIVVVQHMARGFTEGLAQWLGANVSLRVRVPRDGERLEAGTVYIAPDDRHLAVTGDSSASLSDAAPLNGFRPSADFLFDACARSYGSALTALILTGMGQDGVEGLRTVRARGGHVIAQDEESSVVFGMAQKAIEHGLVNEVLPLDAVGRRLQALVTRR